MKNEEIIKKVVVKNNLGEVTKLEKFVSGQINEVFNINDQYVLKLEGGLDFAKGIIGHQGELMQKLGEMGAKVPKVFDFGEIEGKQYLLMEKLRGNNLVYDWPSLDEKQKDNLIAQLARELKIFHSVASTEYYMLMRKDKRFVNLKDVFVDMIGTELERVGKGKMKDVTLGMIEFLRGYYEENIDLLDEMGTAVLVHNDIHPENIFYEDDKLTGIIDWDWAGYAPRDYELTTLINVAYSPTKFMEEGLEKDYENYDATELVTMTKTHYPQLFEAENLEKRIRLYLIEDILSVIHDVQKGRWSKNVLDDMAKKVDVIYKSDWLEKLVD